MRIPDEKIEEVRAATDIVDVVGDYVKLKKSGSRYKGLCPFHQEKTPSFSVDPQQNLYYCFGCQAGGDAFTLVRELEGVEFLEAVRMLAERAGVTLPEGDQSPEEASEVDSIYHALRFAARYFYGQLTQAEGGKRALHYLQQERGLEVATIKRFGLGYAPDRWDGLLKEAESSHVAPEMLEKAGLVLERRDGSGYYDRFRGRVVFPILSHVGKVLGFGGRILEKDSDQPKYINSPQTRVYDKSKVLYGLYQGKQAVRKQEEAILVEGYTDVTALHQAGVENVVASSGTALTAEQVKMLSRYAKRILLLYDADEAGGNATVRAIDLVLEQGLSAYVVTLPKGEDPDTFVARVGRDGFRDYMDEQRQDFTAFIYGQARRRGRTDTPEGEAEVMRRVVEAVAKMPDPLMQETYLRRASDVLDVYDTKLYEELDRIQRDREREDRRSRERASRSSGPAQQPQAPLPEEPPLPEDEWEGTSAAPTTAREVGAQPLPEELVLLRVMLEHGEPLVEFVLGHMALDEFSAGPPRDMAEVFLTMYGEDDVQPQRFLKGDCGDELQQLASRVVMDEYEPSENWLERDIKVPRMNEKPREAAASAMTLLKLDRVDEAIERQRARIFQASRTGEDLKPLQAEMMELHKLRKQIQQRAFLDWEGA